MTQTQQLVLVSVLGMAVLLFMVMRLKLHALVALVFVSLGIGLGAGMSGTQVITSVQKGMGSTLGAIALLVGLGAMIGAMLEVSGGAHRVAETLISRLGRSRAQWALGLTGFAVSIPVFFDVGFIVLVPVVYGLARQTGRPAVYYALPLLAGLAVTHAFVPPTPGPIAVADYLKADLGYVLMFGVVVGLPCMVAAGPLYGRWISLRLRKAEDGDEQSVLLPLPLGEGQGEGLEHGEIEAPPPTPPQKGGELKPPPPFALVTFLILFPLVLIVGKTVAETTLETDRTLRHILGFIGEPIVALLVTSLLCFYMLGTRMGRSRQDVHEIASRALEPAGLILLVTGAGGVLKQVLVDSKAGETLAALLTRLDAPWVLVAFLLALVVRVMQGSATVAMLTAGGLTASLIQEVELSEPRRALLVLAVAAGATAASHVNDSGFWLVNRYLGLSVADTLKTWTVATCIIGVLGLLIVLALWPIVG